MARYIPPRRTYDCYLIFEGEHLFGVGVRNDDGTYTVAIDATLKLCERLGVDRWSTKQIMVNLPAAQIMFVVGEPSFA